MKTFTCAHCKETFTSSWTEEEAEEEAKDLFPGFTPTEYNSVQICDDCHEQLLKWLESLPPEKRARLEHEAS